MFAGHEAMPLDTSAARTIIRRVAEARGAIDTQPGIAQAVGAAGSHDATPWPAERI